MTASNTRKYTSPGQPWWASQDLPRPIPPHLMDDSANRAEGETFTERLGRLTDRRNRLMEMRDAILSAWTDGDVFRLEITERLPAWIDRSPIGHLNRLGVFRGVRSRRDGGWDVLTDWMEPSTKRSSNQPSVWQFFYYAVRQIPV